VVILIAAGTINTRYNPTEKLARPIDRRHPKCADGRWFVEVDFGNDYNAIGGVSKPKILPYMDPVFFECRKDGEEFAFECIKKIHPTLRERDLGQYLKTEAMP
jgi:hypothetical protein